MLLSESLLRNVCVCVSLQDEWRADCYSVFVGAEGSVIPAHTGRHPPWHQEWLHSPDQWWEGKGTWWVNVCVFKGVIHSRLFLWDVINPEDPSLNRATSGFTNVKTLVFVTWFTVTHTHTHTLTDLLCGCQSCHLSTASARNSSSSITTRAPVIKSCLMPPNELIRHD